MPTILEMLGLKMDDNYEKFDGESLIPLIKGKGEIGKIAFSQTGNPLNDSKPPKEPNTHSVRTSKWKLIFNEYDNSKELYDLTLDPEENNNLSNTGLEIEETLWKELKQLMEKKSG
jgi:arylsulfatase A-like enzyme